MKIIKKDFKNGKVKLVIQTSDDLWYLSHIVSKEDSISGRTQRRISIGDKEGERKTIFLKIEVEKKEFSEFSNTLRFIGKIKDSKDERVPSGDYHSFNITLGSGLTIEKENWNNIDKDYLKRSVDKSSKSNILLVACDYGDATFAFFHDYGIEFSGSLSEEIGGKKELKAYEKNKEAFLKLLLKKIEEIARMREVKSVLVGGASMITDSLKKMFKNYEYLKGKTLFTKIGYAGKNGIRELVKRNEFDLLVRGSVFSEHVRLVNKLLEQIGKDKLATYAYPKVRIAIKAGAVKHLLITDRFIKKAKKQGFYKELDKFMLFIEQTKGTTHIIPSNTEQGETIDNLTGIAAILRYKLG